MNNRRLMAILFLLSETARAMEGEEKPSIRWAEQLEEVFEIEPREEETVEPREEKVTSEEQLRKAAASGDISKVSQLISEPDIDLNKRDSNWKTALMLAAENGYGEIVGLLIKNQAKLNFQDKGSKTALMLAAQQGHAGIVKALLAAGADPTITDRLKKTALDYAHEGKDQETIKALTPPPVPFLRRVLKRAFTK